MWSEVTLPAGDGAGLPPPQAGRCRDGVDAFAGRKEGYHPPIGFGKTISENFFCFMWKIGINLILCCILYLSCV